MERSVFFDGTKRLFGILAEPDEKASAAVILIHGWSGYRGGPHRMFVELSRAICKAGYACLRFDLSGRGDSSGRYEDINIDMMIDDTLAASSFVRKETSVSNVVLCGICSGGNVALGAASLDKTIDGLALLSTPLFAPQREELGIGRRSRMRVLKEYALKAVRPRTWYKLAKGMVNFRGVKKALSSDEGPQSEKDSKRNIMNDLKGYSGKMLFVYGSNDTESTGAPDYYRGYTSENNTPVDFQVIEGSDHNFYTVAWQKELEEIVCQWVADQFPR